MNHSITTLFLVLLMSFQVKASFDDEMLSKMSFSFYDVLSDETCKPSEKRWMRKSRAAGTCLAIWALNNQKMHNGLVAKGFDVARINDYVVKKHKVRFFRKTDNSIFAEYEVALRDLTNNQEIQHTTKHDNILIQ